MASTAVSSGYEIWSVPGKPVSVHLRTSVAGQLRQLASESSEKAWESGGILWGRVRDAGDDRFLVSIEHADIFECDHSRGEVWALSDADRKELRKRLRQKNGDLRPVGFWRSHRRPGLYLDKRDFDLMREFFAEPWCIALCVSPSAKAGYFFWEEGEIHRTSSYREFELPYIAQPVAAPRRTQRRPDRARWAIAAGIAALALTPFLSRSTNRPAETPFNMLSMQAEMKPGTVRLKWNPKSKVLNGAKGVTLWIADGLDESKLELTPDQVRSGVLDYKSINADVNFRMQVGPFSESLRIIRDERQMAAVTAPVQPGTMAPTAVAASPEASPPVESGRKSKRSKQTKRQGIEPAPENPVQERPVERSREVELPAPPQLAFGSSRLDRPPILNRAPDLPKVTATVENPRISPLKKAFGWMRLPGTRKDFTPPKAVKQIQPHVYIKESTSVAVRVAIDDQGNVWDADLLTKDIDSQLGLSSVEAAKRWRFEPARVDDKPVGSNMVVRFHFGSD